MTNSGPHISIIHDGPFLRVVVSPPEALPANWSAPSTFTAAPIARMAAKLLSEATGMPIIDQTGGR